MSTENIRVDGSFGEGGGQIIRTSLSLSALTGKPVEIVNVRAKRSKPGLQPQHLMAVKAAAKICDAGLDAAVVGSTRFAFVPTVTPRAGKYRFEIGTAGASPLVIQTVLVPLALAGGESEVVVTGGTHVPHAPTAQYLEHVYAAVLGPHGLNASMTSAAAGFYPRGGGSIEALINPSRLTPVDLVERGRLRAITVYVVTSGLPEHVADRGADTAERALRGFKKPDIVRLNLPSNGQGAAVVVVAECENVITGFSAIGERGKPMERVAQEACAQFTDWYRTGAACDEHLADQLVLPMSLVPETSRWTTSAVTEHLRTVLWLVKHFLPIDASLEEREDGTGLVTLRGVGVG